MFFYISVRSGFLMGLLQVSNLSKSVSLFKYDHEKTYHKSLTLKTLFYPTNFLESRSSRGLCLLGSHQGFALDPPAGSLQAPYLQLAPLELSQILIIVLSYKLIITPGTVALRTKLRSTCALPVCHLSTKLRRIQQTIPQS